MAKFLSSLVFCCAGFSLGWIARGSLLSEPVTDIMTAPAPANAKLPVHAPAEVLSQPVIAQTQTVQTAEVAIETAQDRLKQLEGVVEQFKRYLDDNLYEDAVLHYGQYAHREDLQPLMRSVLRNSLQTYIQNSDERRFSALANAWLESYYSDAEILLLVANHHRESGFLREGLNVMQLAMTYAQGSELAKTRNAFSEFVFSTDTALADQQDWPALQNFYENLKTMGLHRPRDELRLAEMYLVNGNTHQGKQMLEQLVHQPAIGEKVQSLLTRLHESTAIKPEHNDSGFEAKISMRPYGHHYLLPIQTPSGEKVVLLLDTGASTTLLKRQAFDRFSQGNAVFLGERIFNTANGLSRGQAFSVPQVNFGDYSLADLEISVTDVDFGGEFDGLLGMNVLSQFVFQIDQNKHQLLLKPR